MPLPALPLVNPETTTYRVGTGYEDLRTLLRELHEGVLELGVGQCEVRCKDEPERLRLGFELYTQRDGVARWWEFMIRLSRVRRAGGVSGGRIRELFPTTQGRAEIAQLLEAGTDPETLYA